MNQPVTELHPVPDLQYQIIRKFVKIGSKFGYRLQLEGLDNIYDHLDNLSGGAIYAGNHESVIDAFLVGLAIPRELDDKRIFFLGKKSALWRNRFWGQMMDYFGVIPVRKRGNSLAIRKGLEVLQRKQVLGIFPEGHIRYSRKDLEGKVGVARFAFETGSPVIPVGIIGTDGVLPYGGNWPSMGKKVTLYIGTPIYLSDKFDHKDIYDPYALRSATDIIMKEIRKQSKGYGIKPNDAPRLRCMEGISTIITPKGLVPTPKKHDTKDLVKSFEEWLDSIPLKLDKEKRNENKTLTKLPNKPKSKKAEEEFLNWLDEQL